MPARAPAPDCRAPALLPLPDALFAPRLLLRSRDGGATPKLAASRRAALVDFDSTSRGEGELRRLSRLGGGRALPATV